MPDSPVSPIWGWIIIAVLLVFGAFFGASETAYTTANRVKLKVKADNGHKSAALALKIVEKVDHALITVLILNNLLQVAMSSIATFLFIGMGYVNQASFLSTLIVTFAIFVLADSIPKSIAKANPESVAMLNSYLIIVLMTIFFPISIIFFGLNHLLARIFKIKEDKTLTEADLSNIIEASEEAGTLDDQEIELIQSAIDLDTLFVKDVLTPRTKMFSVDLVGLTHEKLQAMIIESTYNRIPVYRGDVDHIVGVIVARAYLKKYLENPQISITKTLTKPYFVPPTVVLDDLLEGFKKNSTHIAFVVDKNQHVLGMVTMEDVLEELVGQTDLKTSRALGKVRE